MKLTNLFVGIGLALPFTIWAQSDIKSTAPEGYLSRGIAMYGSHNYQGSIDQLSHMLALPSSAEMTQQAKYYIALSHFQSGDPACVAYLKKYLEEYPFSLSSPDVRATLADYYFYTGKFGEALTQYSLVNENAFNSDRREDIIYRKAYSELRLANYQEAKNGFQKLAGSKRYGDAALFYDAYVLYANKGYESALAKFMKVNRRGDLGYNAQYYMCQIYFVQGEYSKVLSLGKALLADNNKSDMDGEINRVVGESFYHQGSDDEAYKYISKYLEDNETEPIRTAEYILGVIDYKHADFQKAIEHLGDVSDGNDALAQSAYYFIGQSYRKLDNKSLAAIAFEKACQMNFDRDTQEAAFYNYAVMQNEGSRTPFSKTIDMFEDFLNKFPHSRYSDDVEEYLVTVYMTGNDYNRALSSISHIKNPSDKVLAAKQAVLYKLGIESLSNDNISEAQDYLIQAVELAKYDKAIGAQSNLWLAECYYRSGRFSTAEKYQKIYIGNVKPNDENYGLGYYNLGYSQFQQKKYTDARTSFDKALKSSLAEKLQGDAYNRIGDTYYYSRDYATAESYYDKASRNGGADYSMYQKGIMLGLNKDFSGKVAQMNDLLDKYPNSTWAPAAMLEQADAYVLMNNNKKAISVYESLVKCYPSSAFGRKGLLQLAITQRNAGNEQEAIAAYKRVVQNYPSSEEATVAVEDLKLIYADNGNLQEFASFIKKVPNAPRVDVSDMDRLTFEAAEKAYIANNSNITKMRSYLAKYPNGAYAGHASYYIAKSNYNKGNYSEALEAINEVISQHGDATFVEDALAIKSDILRKQGKSKEAYDTYKQLIDKSSNADNRLTAQLGAMRTAAEMNDFKDVAEYAEALSKAGGLSSEEEKEVTFNRANAYYQLGKKSQAIKDFTALSKDTRNLYGAQSAYYLAEAQYEDGDLKGAEKTLNAFIDEGTRHQYWLARGFILLADVYHKRGEDFEACEYLESLKTNYPGKENDIFKMIDERLGSWKSNAKAPAKSTKSSKSTKSKK